MAIPQVRGRGVMARTETQIFRSQRIVVAVVAAVVAALAGGFLVASAIETSVVVCANKASGALRYSKNGSCNGIRERKLTLNEQGTTGMIGGTGATGGTGASGTPGTSGTTGASGTAGTSGTPGDAGGYPTSMSSRDITGAHTLLADDIGRVLLSRLGTIVTVPTNATVAFAVGTRIDLAVVTGFLYLDPASGVTINAGTSRIEFDAGNYQIGTLIKIATNEWYLLSGVNET